jgi:hypothetical protein
MKYSAQIICAVLGALPTLEITASSDNAAVDKARAKHDVPVEGGDYEIVVTCLEATQVYSAEAQGMVERPAGFEVSRFKCSHEPEPHVAEAVYTQREADALAKAEAEKEAQIRAKVLAEFGLDESGKKVK